MYLLGREPVGGHANAHAVVPVAHVHVVTRGVDERGDHMATRDGEEGGAPSYEMRVMRAHIYKVQSDRTTRLQGCEVLSYEIRRDTSEPRDLRCNGRSSLAAAPPALISSCHMSPRAVQRGRAVCQGP